MIEKREQKGNPPLETPSIYAQRVLIAQRKENRKGDRNWLHKRAWREAEGKVEVDGAAIVADGSR